MMKAIRAALDQIRCAEPRSHRLLHDKRLRRQHMDRLKFRSIKRASLLVRNREFSQSLPARQMANRAAASWYVLSDDGSAAAKGSTLSSQPAQHRYRCGLVWPAGD
jgi:hypothetical protein